MTTIAAQKLTTLRINGITMCDEPERKRRALHSADLLRRDGYNLFAFGPVGGGKHTIVGKFPERQAAASARRLVLRRQLRRPYFEAFERDVIENAEDPRKKRDDEDGDATVKT